MQMKMKIDNPESSSLFFFLLCFFCVFVVFSNAIESPQFSVVHSESDFEIRLYRDSSWMSAPVQEISFEKATKQGFHRLYQYIHGDNLDSSELKMTAPVLTSITSEAHNSDYYVRYYVSTKFQGIPPQPLPDLNLQFSKWASHCVAVRMFSGFATDDTIRKEVEALVTSLSRLQPGNSVTLVDRHAYTVAQYNASFHASGRFNEVWMDVSGVTKEGCLSNHEIYSVKN